MSLVRKISARLKALLFQFLDKYLLSVYTYMYTYLPVDIHRERPFEYASYPLSSSFSQFYFLSSIIILSFSGAQTRVETNLNRNGPAGSSVELRVFVRTPFVCRVRAQQFRVRNLGDHVRKESFPWHDCGDNHNCERTFSLKLVLLVCSFVMRFIVYRNV